MELKTALSKHFDFYHVDCQGGRVGGGGGDKDEFTGFVVSGASVIGACLGNRRQSQNVSANLLQSLSKDGAVDVFPLSSVTTQEIVEIENKCFRPDTLYFTLCHTVEKYKKKKYFFCNYTAVAPLAPLLY